MDLTGKFDIAHKLFRLVTFVLDRILRSTATDIMALRKTPTIGLINRLINPDVAVGSLASRS